MSNWGQGAINNSIGWGQGAINNIIGWASVYALSWSGYTSIIEPPVVSAIILAFKNRVSADSGFYENNQELSIILTNLNNI
tara:strand:+ start:40 stop:282 length:243 start_codon:yes stop_codon:yes gene_type:complete